MFLFPWYLVLLALAGPILALYFLKSRPVRQNVPSNAIWRLVLAKIRPNSFLQRFQNSVFLLLQLLVLLFVVLALARPAFLGSGGLLRVVIIDQSASMQAQDIAPSRWQAARDRARALLSGHRGRVSLWTLSDHLACRVSPVDDPSLAIGALERLHPSHAGSPTAEQVLRQLRDLEGLKPDEIYLLTDTLALEVPRTFLPQTSLHVEIFAKQGQNCAITDVEALWNPSRKTVQAKVSITNENSRLLAGTLRVAASDTTVPGVPLSIDPDTQALINVELPGSGPFRFDLEVPDALNVSKADDSWFLCDAGIRPVVALDAPPGSILHRLRAVLPLIEFQMVDRLSASETVALLTTTGRDIPSGLSGLSFMTSNLVPAQDIVQWDVRHPLMRYINWDAVASGTLSAGLLPGVPLLEGIGGTIITEERRRRGRHESVRVYAGFDPDDQAIQNDVFLPVFLYNSLEYLLRERFPRLSYRVGQDALAAIWKGAQAPDTAGIHPLPDASGKSVAVNLGAPEEARLSPGKPFAPGQVQKIGQQLKEQEDSPWTGLLTLGFVLLLGEWYLFIRRN